MHNEKKPPSQLWKRLFGKRSMGLVFIILSLSLISFATSYDGFITLSFGDYSKADFFQMIFLAWVVLLIQFLLVFALMAMVDKEGFFIRSGWVTIYIIAMLVSVFFSYSFYYELFRAEGYAKDNFMIQANDKRYEFLQFKNEFENVHAAMTDLSNYSSRMAIKEEKFGGTCEPSIGAGAGPRRAFRQTEAQLFGNFIPGINDLLYKITADIAGIDERIKSYSPQIKAQELEAKINNEIAKVNLYRDNLIFRRISTALDEHTGENRKQMPMLNRVGKIEPIDCPDSNFERKAKSFSTSLENLIPIKPIELFDPNADKERFLRTMNVFFVGLPNILFGGFEDPKENKATAITFKDISPVFIALIVDLFIFVVGLLDGIANKEKEDLFQFFGQQNENYRRLKDYSHNIGPHKIFFIPVDDSASETEIKFLEFFEFFEFLIAKKKASLLVDSLPARWLSKSAKRKFGITKNDSRHFRVFKMYKKTWKEVILAGYNK